MIKVIKLPFTISKIRIWHKFCELLRLESCFWKAQLVVRFQRLTDARLIRWRGQGRALFLSVTLQGKAKMSGRGLGFGLSALLRGSYRPFKVCNFMLLCIMVLFLWNKSFSAAMKARFSLRREWSHALLEQTICIVITLEFRPKKNCKLNVESST